MEDSIDGITVRALVSAVSWVAPGAAQGHASAGGDHQRSEAAELRNPVTATPQSIGDGKKVYDARCASCHGESGKGDGKMVGSMKPPLPSDFTD